MTQTAEQIDVMEAGHELNVLVAERVMGWTIAGWAWCYQDEGGWQIDSLAAGDREAASYNVSLPVYVSVPGATAASNPHEKRVGDYSIFDCAPVPAFSTDIAEAWRVVERLHKPNHTDFALTSATRGWAARFGIGLLPSKAYGATPELAICRAAIKAAI